MYPRDNKALSKVYSRDNKALLKVLCAYETVNHANYSHAANVDIAVKSKTSLENKINK